MECRRVVGRWVGGREGGMAESRESVIMGVREEGQEADRLAGGDRHGQSQGG